MNDIAPTRVFITATGLEVLVSPWQEADAIAGGWKPKDGTAPVPVVPAEVPSEAPLTLADLTASLPHAAP